MISVRGPGSHSAQQLTDLSGGALMGNSRSGGKAHLNADHLARRARSSLHLLCLPPFPDPALYEAFTGRARVIPRCQFCLSDSHSSHDCTFGPYDSRHYQNRQPPPRRGAVRTQVAQICRMFNQLEEKQCHFKQCRYAHLCPRCNQPHPVSECDRRQSRRPRST